MEPIVLRPWRAFTRNGQAYVFNVERVLSRKVGQDTLALLHALERAPAAPVTEDQEIELLEMELVRTSEDASLSEPGPHDPPEDAWPVKNLTMFVAQQCNFRCLYCYGGGGEYGAPGMMSQETAFRTVDWLTDQWTDFSKTHPEKMQRLRKASKSGKPELSLAFFGGEPLLNFPLIQDVVAYAKDKEAGCDFVFSFAISSNCSLLDDAKLAFFREHGFTILVGFDGPPEIQNRNRPRVGGVSSYDMVASNIKKAIEALPGKVSLRATLWKKGEASVVAEHLSSFSPERFQVIEASPSLHEPEALSPDPPGGEDIAASLFGAADAFIQAVKDRDVERVNHVLSWLNFRWALGVIGPRPRRGVACGVGRSLLAVSVDGDLYPCHRFVGHERYALGSVFDGPPSNDRLEYATSLAAMQRGEPCLSCWAAQVCDGGCAYDHLSRTGDRFTPSPTFCQYMHSSLEMAIYLDNELDREDRAFLHEQKITPRRPCPLDM